MNCQYMIIPSLPACLPDNTRPEGSGGGRDPPSRSYIHLRTTGGGGWATSPRPKPTHPSTSAPTQNRPTQPSPRGTGGPLTHSPSPKATWHWPKLLKIFPDNPASGRFGSTVVTTPYPPGGGGGAHRPKPTLPLSKTHSPIPPKGGSHKGQRMDAPRSCTGGLWSPAEPWAGGSPRAASAGRSPASAAPSAPRPSGRSGSGRTCRGTPAPWRRRTPARCPG